MLKRPYSFALVLTPLLLAGCGSLPFFGGGDAEVTDPTAATPDQPVPAAPAQAGDPTGDAGFEDPLVESDAQPDDPEAAEGLIPLISEDAAAKLAQSGRLDPFATIALTTEDIVTTGEGGVTAPIATLLPKLPELPAIPSLQIPPIGPLAPEPPPPPPPALPANLPQGSPDLPFAPELPPLPEPTIANELVVTGVITLNGETHAIVEGPDFKSTYVREGDRIVNGQVLVKRIEGSPGGSTLVVFEELGIEVVKGVGEGVSDLPPAA
ncbi:MAG: hypothetical protein ACPGVO_00420 [Spirulinaceae cyanobacterium]